MLTAERCLWCGGPLLNGCTIPEMMFADDSLCGLCRSQLTLISHQVKLGELSVRGLVLYDEAFMKMLVQYKECMDEALQDVFLLPRRDRLRRRYRHFTLVPMPSSRANRETRGFDTIPQLFSGLRLPIVELLEKTEDYVQQGSASQRQQAASHIRLIPGVPIPDGKLLLIDDVLTTGSTLNAAHALLPAADQALVLAVNQRFLSPAFAPFRKLRCRKSAE